MAEGFRKLKEQDLVIGKPLPWAVYDSNGSMLIKEGFVIKNEDMVTRLINRGGFVHPSDLEGRTLQAERLEKAVKPTDFSPFKLLEEVYSHLAIAFASVESDAHDFTPEIMKLVDDVQRACHRDPSAALASLFILQGTSYPIKHSVDVAILVELISKASGHQREKRRSIIAAALTMNVSMIELQETLYRQESPLTPEQTRAIQAHPKKSVLLLQGAGVTDRSWLTYVLAHHEKADGSGYPNKLKQGQYPEEVGIINLADSYCARLSPRAYRDPLLHKSILKDILLDNGASVSPQIAQLFIKELGFYPPGMIVQLMNTEIGVVTRRGDKPDAPVVHACMKPQIGNYGAPVKRNTKMDAHKVRRVLQHNDPDITFTPRNVWRFNEDE